MCLIVDTNVAHRVFLARDDDDFRHVFACLFEGRMPRVSIVYGGKLLQEYMKSAPIRRALTILDRAGSARKISDALVESETQTVVGLRLCQSDDEHIIGLALASNVRLLCSNDRDLHSDFTNRRLLNRPRGSVYQKARHRHLLDRFCR